MRLTSVNNFRLTQLFLLIATGTIVSKPAQATSFSISTGHYKQNLILGENTTNISPEGYVLTANFDVNDSFAIHFDYNHYDRAKSFLINNSLNYEKDSWGVGGSFYLEQWTFSAQYSDIDELLTVKNDRRSINMYEEDYQSPSYLFSTGYDFDVGTDITTWFFNISATLQYSDWNLNLRRVEKPIENNNFHTGINKGDTLFGDFSLSAARFINFSKEDSLNNNTLYVGGSVSWSHLLSGESSIVSRNGVATQQFVSSHNSTRNRLSQSSFSQSVQGDEYGLLSLFISYSLTESFSIDLDYSTSFSADKNSAGTYLTLGYIW